MAQPTGRQRNYALAMGIDVVSYADGDLLSQRMDLTKETLNGPPNRGQLQLAHHWAIEVCDRDSGWQLLGKLYAMIKLQVFIYSVARRWRNAKWRTYLDSDIPDEWIESLSKSLYNDPETMEFVESLDNSLSGTKGSEWYRFGKRQGASQAVQIVVEALSRDFPHYAHQVEPAMRATPSKAPRKLPAIAESVPIIRTRHTNIAAKYKKKSKGCLIVLVLTFATIAATTCIVVLPSD